jgi:hypothetical protein
MKRWSALSRLATIIGLTLVLWVWAFLAIVGAEHIVYDHMLFGLLK